MKQRHNSEFSKDKFSVRLGIFHMEKMRPIDRKSQFVKYLDRTLPLKVIL